MKASDLLGLQKCKLTPGTGSASAVHTPGARLHAHDIFALAHLLPHHEIGQLAAIIAHTGFKVYVFIIKTCVRCFFRLMIEHLLAVTGWGASKVL